MKKFSILMVVLFVFTVLSINAQETKSCCSSKASAVPTSELSYSKDIKVKEGEKLLLMKANITCENCKAHIEKEMAYTKGVKDVVADVKTKCVTVAYNPQKTDEQKLLASLKKLNYGGEIVKTTDNSGSNCCKKDSSCEHKQVKQ